MKKQTRFFSIMMATAMALSLTACGGDSKSASDAGGAGGDVSADAPADDASADGSSASDGADTDGKTYTIGIVQQLEHPALDSASEGFMDALNQLLGEGNVTFDLQNAQGEQANCAIGPVLAGGIVAEIGDISAFHSSDALAKYAGLMWKSNQSGDFDGEDTPMSKAGNRYLRYYLGEAANSLRKHNVEYGTYYRKKCSEVPKHQHKRALALTSRKFVRLVYEIGRASCRERV